MGDTGKGGERGCLVPTGHSQNELKVHIRAGLTVSSR